ncbi:GNAT family N-acetyltransferase [Sutcliffiella horikoshii]|uniref:GNAT family N-acetyltransferase n=1 Tax=Sutcliffiella horikoshii TaxID=79883 RepID=UPI001CFD64F1|nr:GNAT family N-acetyltransferase [Sutcliffiella horikoshii]
MRVLSKKDAEQFQRLRLESLIKEPTSFASSYEEEQHRTYDDIKTRIPENQDSFIYGAFVEEILVGMTGFQREDKIKFKHKGFIWGVYITEEYRGKGYSKQLLENTLTKAKNIQGLKQIQLTVAATNNSAKKLYESYGFETFGYEKGALYVDGFYLDEEHMVLHISK